MLLAWRFHARSQIAADPERLVSGLSPRLNQTALAILSLVDDAQLRDEIATLLLMEQQGRRLEHEATDESRALRALSAAFRDATTPYVPIAEVAKRFNDSLDQFHKSLNNRAVGAIVRRLGISTTKSRGIYVISQGERAKVAHQSARMGLIEGDTMHIVSETEA